MELEHNKRMEHLSEQMESFRDPVKAISFLHKQTVNALHEEQTNLRNKIKTFEKNLSVEVAKSVKLTNESFQIQKGTNELIAIIHKLEAENAEQVSALNH